MLFSTLHILWGVYCPMKSPMKGTVNESHFHHLGVSTADFVKEESLDDNSLFLLELKLPYSPRFAVCLEWYQNWTNIYNVWATPRLISFRCLKGLCHAIQVKRFLRINWIPKQNGPVLIFETIIYYLFQRIARMDMAWNFKKLGQLFQILITCLPKITKKLLW